MNQHLKDVANFSHTFNHSIGDNSASVESLADRQLRIRLLFEELAELAEASDCKGTFNHLCETFGFYISEDCDGPQKKNGRRDRRLTITEGDGDNVNKLEELDALADLEYVLMHKVLSAGLQHVFDEAFATVHTNNMTKAHRSLEHAQATIKALHLDGDHYSGSYDIVEKGNGFILVNEFGKTIKPHDHKKVKLKL